ncbi:hypothetical protein OUZ56_022683 [Daphnia magna]|uniref:Uncharacterized protein n=1 Tax=Daphnia magna TaxID=35525 RepID=A0ABR0AXE6_9CRUS|nr:hypothetical protein OUZ56_022683 [Daphnia magna]
MDCFTAEWSTAIYNVTDPTIENQKETRTGSLFPFSFTKRCNRFQKSTFPLLFLTDCATQLSHTRKLRKNKTRETGRKMNTARWDPVKKGHETMVFAPDDQASDKSLGHSSSSNWEIPSADGILFDVCWNVTIGMERSLVVLQQYQPKFWVEALPNQPPASPPLGRLLMATRRALSVELANG